MRPFIFTLKSDKWRVSSGVPSLRSTLDEIIFRTDENFPFNQWTPNSKKLTGEEYEGVYVVSYKSRFSKGREVSCSKIELFPNENGTTIQVTSGFNRAHLFKVCTAYGFYHVLGDAKY